MNQFIVVDDPNILRDLKLFEKKLNSELLTFSQIIEYPFLLHGNNKFIKTIFILSKDTFLHRTNEIRKIIRNVPEVMPKFLIRAPLDEDVFSQSELDKDLHFTNVPEGSPAFFIAKNIINAFTLLQYQIESFEHQYKFNLSTNHIAKLTKIGMSLVTEKDFTKLLRDILYSAREICVADAGSLYLVEKDEEGKPKNLRFKISALELNSNEFLLPINKQSIAGYVA
ncbi:MAG: HD family phosphohydrolase, partial [Leptospiraceae bacterium]|nr:HD family phosphohydrolase [Leptospiraceae bacterium]